MSLKWIIRTTALASTLSACLFCGSRLADAKDSLPEGTATVLIDSDIAFLQKGLAKMPEPDKRAVPTLKAAAMMIALNAQNNLDGKEAVKMAAIRDQALKIAAELAKKDKDFAAAKKLAEGFKDAKGGDKKELKLSEMHKFDLAELMSQFRLSRIGGRNIEADLKEQATKVTDTKLAWELAARVTNIAQYSADLPADKAVGAKKKIWDDLVKEMKKLGEEAATEASKGAKADNAALAKKLQAINLNCKNCHNEFRLP